MPLQYSESVQQRLTERLARIPDVVAAYLFGSHARGEATVESDWDVGIWLKNAPRTFAEYPLELAEELTTELGVPIDVVVLNDAPSDLVHRVLRDGILLVDRDRSGRIQLEVRARNDYFDMLPIRTTYRRARPGGRT